jgi:hypothetical protein
MQRPARHIWLVNLFFGPDSAPTGALLESAALALQRQGYTVEVLTGDSAYNQHRADSPRRFHGKVHRLWSGPRKPRGVLGRLLSWLAFYLATCRFLFSRRLPGTVVIMTTPPFLHALFVLRNLCTAARARLILWNQDTYPEVLAAVGLARPGAWWLRLLAWMNRWWTARVDRVLVLDGAMKSILLRHGGRDVRVLPNWEIEVPTPTTSPQDDLDELIARARQEYRHIVLYTGNYGWGHDLTLLLEWLARHPQQRDFFFLFVGGGEKWRTLTEFAGSGVTPALAVRPYVARARVPRLIAQADLGLVCLERSCLGLMSPSKIHGYLALGKPLLYLGPAGSNVAEALEQGCGFRVEETDAAGLEQLLRELAQPGFDLAVYGERARQAAHTRYLENVAAMEFLHAIADPERKGPIPG